MRLLKVGAAALNQTPLAWDPNRDHVLAAIEAARAEAVSILCLPELCITGYGCEDMFHASELPLRAWRMVRDDIAPATRGMVMSVGLPVFHMGALYNTVALLVDGRVAGLVAKQNLAGDGLHYEPRWFKPWPRGAQARARIDGDEVPLGDLYFDVKGVRIGFEVCEDAWVADRPGAHLAKRGVDFILNPSASHFAFGKQAARRRIVVGGSRAFGASYVYANLLGNEAGRAIYDGGTIIAAGGAMRAEGVRFSFAPWRLLTAVVDVDETRSLRAKRSAFEPDTDDASDQCVYVDFSLPEPASGAATEARSGHGSESSDWERGTRVKHEEFARAVSLGLFDYLRKSRSQGYVVSLSGGADSAAVTCLVASMVGLAVLELGTDGTRERLGHIAGLGNASDGRAMVGALLTTAYQGTQQSSNVTRDAARGVAEALGSTHHELDVDFLVNGYRALVQKAVGRELSWRDDDIALQNIQARVRGPGAWMLANLSNALLLATSNRSEAAVGYATMDGDTCGGLSPIAGIDKAYLREWLRWMEEEGPEGLAPVPALALVNAQAPTAELRPADQGQTDEDDLMPYRVLDAIERLAIRDKKMPAAVLRVLSADLEDVPPEQLRAWVRRFFELWSRNQWKRERYAPSFHLDEENLDPKTWCRFPILSGGYERELAELDALDL